MEATVGTEVLACSCADCLHWEIVRNERGVHIHCKTCEHRFPVEFYTAPHTKLSWVEREE